MAHVRAVACELMSSVDCMAITTAVQRTQRVDSNVTAVLAACLWATLTNAIARSVVASS